MTSIKSILFFLGLFIFPVIGNNCSCGPYIKTFHQAIPPVEWMQEFYIFSAKVTAPRHNQYMEVEIIENIHNTIEYERITILGQDGLNCGETLDSFELNDTYILNVYPGFYNPSTTNDTFYLDGCGRNWLRLEDNIVTGPIQPDVNHQDYEIFKDSLMLRISTDVEDITQLSQAVQIFPNPIQDVLNIQSINYPIDRVTIFSITGQKIIEKKVGFHENTLINMDNVLAGLYFIKIEINGQVVIKKVLKN